MSPGKPSRAWPIPLVDAREQDDHHARRRPRTHLLRRRAHHSRRTSRDRRTSPRPPTRDRVDAAGRAHRRLDLDRGHPAESRVPAACRPGPARAAVGLQSVGGAGQLRRRGLREPVAVVRSGGRRARHVGARARPHPAVQRTLRGGVLRPAHRRVDRRAAGGANPHDHRGLGRPHRRAVGAAGHRAGLPVREPRRADRRDAAPPARADLRVSVRHAAHGRARRIGGGSADALRRHPRVRAGGGARRAAGEHWTAFVPFAARWPIEVHLLPHRHVPDLAALDDAERAELAVLYRRLLRGIDALLYEHARRRTSPRGTRRR